jgi:uncharacterized protein YndB with AHSA1/START domain
MKNTLSIEIAAPIARVFDFIHDPEKHKLWLHGLEETIFEPDYDPKHPLGAHFKQKIWEGKAMEVYEGEVIDFKRPSHMGVRLTGKSLTAVLHYRLESIKKVTHVIFTSELTFKSVAMKALATLSAPLLRGILKEQMIKLKQVAENKS